MSVTLRPWTLEDVDFSLMVRNHPECMKWFRQDISLTLEIQEAFIAQDLATPLYNGNIILADGVKAGLCGVKHTGEFTIALLPKFKHKGVATEAMRLLIKKNRGIWSEVFVGNPALEWFIAKLGFKILRVNEKAYFKRGSGFIDTVLISHE